MTRSKADKIELLQIGIDNLSSVRKMLKAMGEPLSRISKMDDAISAIQQVIIRLETK